MMNSKQIKRHYHISENQLAKLRDKGMPCELIGARYNYDKDKIDKWASENFVELLGYRNEEFVSTQELQEILGVSKDITDKWIAAGCPKISVHEKKHLYRIEDLTEWLGFGRMSKEEVGSLMTTQELCEEFFVSGHTIKNWIKRGMPYYNFEKRVYRYELEKVQEWLDNEN